LLRDRGEGKRRGGIAAIGGERSGESAEGIAFVAGAETGGNGSVWILAGVSAGGGRRSGAGGDGASATSEGDQCGAAEERPGGFGDAGAFIAMRFAAGGVDGRRGHAAVADRGAIADRVGAAAGAGEESVASGAAPGRKAEAGERFIWTAWAAMAGGGGVEPGGEECGGYADAADRCVR